MIRNKTRNTVLANNHATCRSILSKSFGLRFARKLNDKAMVFPFGRPARMTFDMLFVFQVIDVLFLDEENKVIEIKKNFRPWTIYTSKNKSKTIIELPEGAIEESRTVVGDEILIQ